MLERAIEIAARAHAGQFDKAGQPYILHPLRIMMRLQDPDERMAAVLHDVVEDSEVTLQQLVAEGFSPVVVAAVDALTKRPGESRRDAALRAAANAVARRVKLADNADNMDLSRIPSPTAKDHARLEEYRAIRELLLEAERAVSDPTPARVDTPPPLEPQEFHVSLRVPAIAPAARFYTWLLGVAPRAQTDRYVTFVSEALKTNFVIVVSDGKVLHQDTLYHLGVDLGSREAVVDAQQRAVAAGFVVHKPARTTWRGTPLHELWLRDPGGNLVELYARLTDAERAAAPADLEPTFL